MSRRSVSLLTCLKLHTPKQSSLLVAVSGGKDSVALLDGLVRVKRLLDLRLEVAHVDHGLRKESCEDSAFVEELARKYGLKFHKKELVKPKSGVNIENWGRKERYAYFKELLLKQKLGWIVTAHHSNDVAETFLMRMVSNKELRSIHARNSKNKILRPLLTISRTEIEKYILRNTLAYKEDQSNANNNFLRNKVRNVLIPNLQHNFHVRCPQWIAERAMDLDRDSKCLDRLAKAQLKSIAGAELVSDIFAQNLRTQPVEIAIRMVEFTMLKQLGFRLGRRRAMLVRRVILGKLKNCSLPAGASLSWVEGKLTLKR